jgi:hypothetical protein
VVSGVFKLTICNSVWLGSKKVIWLILHSYGNISPYQPVGHGWPVSAAFSLLSPVSPISTTPLAPWRFSRSFTGEKLSLDEALMSCQALVN